MSFGCSGRNRGAMMRQNNDKRNMSIATGLVFIGLAAVIGAVSQDWKTGRNNLIDYTRAQMGDAKLQYQEGVKAGDGAQALSSDDPRIPWFEKSAKGGYVPAMLALGDLYNAATDEASGDQAVHWYQLATDAGNAEAARKLGQAYDMGRGTLVSDSAKAEVLYEKAAKGGDPQGETLYGVDLVNDGKIPDGVTWLMKGEAAGDIKADVALGNLYYDTRSPVKDWQKAGIYYTKAANGGATAIMLNLGNLYYSGIGEKKDLAESYKWVLIAQQRGVPGMDYTAHGLEEELKPADLNEGRQRANTWLLAHKE